MPEWEEQAPLWARLLIPVGLAALLAIALLSAACERPQPVAADAACSPKAEAWWLAEMTKACGAPGQKGALKSDECPAAAAIDAEYLRREEAECSAK